MKLLLIEDNIDDILAVRRLARFSVIPVEIKEVQDGAEALEWLAHCANVSAGQEPALPDVILLDIGLLGLTGFDVLRRIKEDTRWQEIWVIVVSGSDEDDDVLRGLQLGAHSHIVKPITMEEFAWIVNSVDHYRLRLATVRAHTTQCGEPGILRGLKRKTQRLRRR